MIEEVLRQAVESEASDIHLKCHQVPYFRIQGQLVPSGFEPLVLEVLHRLVDDLLPAHLRERFGEEHEIDFTHLEEGVGRFRVSAFLGAGIPTFALRHVKESIPTIESLNLPGTLHRCSDFASGLVILSGTTGSGKSTTVAALIDEINRKHERRILTIEDPIEYAFTDQRSVITQREVGLDTPDFQSALRHVLRQDPDVILLGEMRDMESVRVGLLAAETGHLVFTTLHAGTAAIAVPRMLDLFPPGEQEQVRMALAANLRAIICQRLLTSSSGGLWPAVEILLNTPTISKLISKNQLSVLTAGIETGAEDGMQTFNQHLYQLIREGRISEKEGLRNATNPESLAMNLKGVFLDEGRRILSSL